MTKISPMRRAVGLVLIFIGLMWFLIGVNIIGGSQFSGSIPFAIAGAVIASGGVVVLQYGVKRRPTTSDPTTSAPTTSAPTTSAPTTSNPAPQTTLPADSTDEQ